VQSPWLYVQIQFSVTRRLPKSPIAVRPDGATRRVPFLQELRREEASFAKEGGGRVKAAQAKLQAAKQQVLHLSLVFCWLPPGRLHASALASWRHITAGCRHSMQASWVSRELSVSGTRAKRQLQTPASEV
jgi:hypothetical protein